MKLKIRRSPLLDVIPLRVFTCLSAQNNKVQSCVTRGPCRASWSGFYCAYWVHGTKALKYKITMKLILHARYHAYTNVVCQNFCDVCQYKYFLSMIRNICCHKQSLTLSIIFDLKIYHKHWITIYYLYKSAWPLTVSQTVGVLTEAALPWLRGGFRQHVPSVNQLHF